MRQFLERFSVRAALLSVVLIVPCEWHRRIEAGDLGSHVYNAWLASLVKEGLAPGVYVVRQWNNVLFDLMLSIAGRAVGLPSAERIVVPLCVLVFFWGTFTFVAAMSGRPPWAQVPLLAMLAYGWTFHAGFLNYYLSIGLGSFAAANLIENSRGRRLAGLVLLALAYVAHPLGAVWAVGATIFVVVGGRLRAYARVAFAPAIALLLLALVVTAKAHFRSVPRVAHWYAESGLDQFYVFGRVDRAVAIAIMLVGAVTLGIDTAKRWEGWRTLTELRTPLELYGLTVAAALLAPFGVFLRPGDRVPLGWINERITIVSALMFICVLAMTRPRRSFAVVNSVLAIAFFAASFKATGLANRIEERVQALVHTVPQGSRVVYGTEVDFNGVEPSKFFNHLIDRACVGWCFLYSNYEAPTRQFRVRVEPGSPVETDEPNLDERIATWRPNPGDPPTWLVYQFQPGDTVLAIRGLAPCASSDVCAK